MFYSAPSGGGHPPQLLQPPHLPQQELSSPLVVRPLLLPPPTTMAKLMVRERGRGKETTMALAALATTTGVATPRYGPPSTITGLAPSQCGQGCVFLSSQHIHHSLPSLLHWHTMTPLRPSLHAPTGTSTAPAAGRNLYLVALDGHVRSVVIGQQLLQHHGLDSPDGHRLDHRL
jgi:hypothetical protein